MKKNKDTNTKYSNNVLQQISRDTHNHFGSLKITEVIKDTVLPEYLGDVNSDSAENLYLKFKKLIEREENPDIYIDKIILEFCNPIRDINRMTDNTKLIDKINRLLRVINLTINDNATIILQKVNIKVKEK